MHYFEIYIVIGIRNVILGYEIVVISRRPTSGYKTSCTFLFLVLDSFQHTLGSVTRLPEEKTRGARGAGSGEGGGTSSYHLILVEKMFTHFGSDISEIKV